MAETRRPAEILADKLANRGRPTGTDAYRDTLDPGEPLTPSEKATVMAGLMLLEGAASNSPTYLDRSGLFRGEDIAIPSCRQVETLKRRLGRASAILPATKEQAKQFAPKQSDISPEALHGTLENLASGRNQQER